MAAPGYPGTPERGIALQPAQANESLLVFQAGTAVRDGTLVSSGGRVLNVVGLGETMQEALRNAYRGVAETGFAGGVWRSDIGFNLTDT